MATPPSVQPGVFPPLGAQTSVLVALELGWDMGELVARTTATLKTSPVAPLGMSKWTEADLWDLTVRHAQSKATGLEQAFVDARLDAAGLTTFVTTMDGLIGHADALDGVTRAYSELWKTLAGAHSRLGKACELGYGVEDLCRPRMTNTDTDPKQFGERLNPIQRLLADLASSLPAHSSRAVTLSIAQWKTWSANPRLDKETVDLAAEPVQHALRRQGDVWRSVLSGQKLGTDMLSADDYLRASKALFRNVVRSRPWLWIVLLVAAALVGLGVYFVVTAASALKAVSGVVLSVLGALGISTASLKRAFGQLETELGGAVWGAELDNAIADAITFAPGARRVKPKRRSGSLGRQKVEVPPLGPD